MKEISDSVNKENNPIIDINKTKAINYNSYSFQRGLNKIKKQEQKDEEMIKPDYSKMGLTYNI
jgi:hypothetical protein